MPAKHPEKDRNFDDLTQRFARNIYQTPKGKLRLAILERDFGVIPNTSPLDVLDVGAGQGQFGLWLATQGHDVTLVDVSAEMLAKAKNEAAGVNFAIAPTFIQQDLWAMCVERESNSCDLVVCHAVLEWLEHPLEAVEKLAALVRPGGYLSLLFYNIHGLVFKNLLRTNYKRVLKGDTKGQRGSLTPINPLAPMDVLGVIERLGLTTLAHSGVRVFHDYILNRENRLRDYETVEALELSLSNQEPYRGLGRYVHVLAQKKMASPAGIEPTSKP